MGETELDWAPISFTFSELCSLRQLPASVHLSWAGNRWWESFSKAPSSTNFVCSVNISSLDQLLLFWYRIILSLWGGGRGTVVSIREFWNQCHYSQGGILECLDFYPLIRAHIPTYRDAQFQLKNLRISKYQSNSLDFFLKIQEMCFLKPRFFILSHNPAT